MQHVTIGEPEMNINIGDLMTMKRQDVMRSIYMTNGKIFHIKFVKKDGSVRPMTCRLGVHKHLKGGESTTRHLPNLITVFDLQNNGYRNVNLDTVIEFKFGHETHDVN